MKLNIMHPNPKAAADSVKEIGMMKMFC